jgi:hypothetical protein
MLVGMPETRDNRDFQGRMSECGCGSEKLNLDGGVRSCDTAGLAPLTKTTTLTLGTLIFAPVALSCLSSPRVLGKEMLPSEASRSTIQLLGDVHRIL